MVKIVFVGASGTGKTSFLEKFKTDKFPDDFVPSVFDDDRSTVALVDDDHLHLSLVDVAGVPIGALKDDPDQRRRAYRGTDIFVICFSVSSRGSFEQVRSKWLPELEPHLIRKHESFEWMWEGEEEGEGEEGHLKILPQDPVGVLLLGTQADLLENDVVRSVGASEKVSASDAAPSAAAAAASSGDSFVTRAEVRELMWEFSEFFNCGYYEVSAKEGWNVKEALQSCCRWYRDKVGIPARTLRKPKKGKKPRKKKRPKRRKVIIGPEVESKLHFGDPETHRVTLLWGDTQEPVVSGWREKIPFHVILDLLEFYELHTHVLFAGLFDFRNCYQRFFFGYFKLDHFRTVFLIFRSVKVYPSTFPVAPIPKRIRRISGVCLRDFYDPREVELKLASDPGYAEVRKACFILEKIDTLRQFVSRNPHLYELESMICGLKQADVVLEAMTTLQKISAWSLSAVSYFGSRLFVPSEIELRPRERAPINTTVFSWVTRLQIRAVDLPLQSFPNVTSLTISSIDVLPEVLSKLDLYLPRLRNLQLARCRFHEADMSPLFCHPKVERLVLVNLRDATLEPAALTTPRAKSLKTVFLSGVQVSPGVVLAYLLRHESLQSLSAFNISPDEVVIRNVSRKSRLDTLELAGQFRFVDMPKPLPIRHVRLWLPRKHHLGFSDFVKYEQDVKCLAKCVAPEEVEKFEFFLRKEDGEGLKEEARTLAVVERLHRREVVGRLHEADGRSRVRSYDWSMFYTNF